MSQLTLLRADLPSSRSAATRGAASAAGANRWLLVSGYRYCIAGKSGSLPRPPGVRSRTFQIGQIESTARRERPALRGDSLDRPPQLGLRLQQPVAREPVFT
jgi:hypothetical protein